MSERIQFQLRNRFDEIPPAHERISTWLSEHGAFAEAEYLANLAVEELVTNCIKYGYDDSQEHLIRIELALSEDEMVVVLEDDGHPFDPLSLPAPDTSLPVEERPIGGLGIHLLRQMFDTLDYSRVNGHNRVVLRKKSPGSGD